MDGFLQGRLDKDENVANKWSKWRFTESRCGACPQKSRGLFGSGLVNRDSQEGRAAALKAYVESALKNPLAVILRN